VTWIVLLAAAFLAFQSHKQIRNAAEALRAIDRHAHDAQTALRDLRAGQQAYVALGQGLAFWMPKVASTSEGLTTTLAAMRLAAATSTARSSVDESASAMTEFSEIDKRARDYIRAGQTLMAGDVIFTEGGQAVANASREVEMARQAEHQEFDAREAAARRQQAMLLGGATILTALVALLLAPAGWTSDIDLRPATSTPLGVSRLALDADGDGVVSHAKRAPVPAPAKPTTAAAAAAPASPAPATPATMGNTVNPSASVFRATADLATDFGRVRDSEELSRLLARTADITEASGLIVWLADQPSGDLHPVLTHGYSPQVMARIPTVPKSADNAAAAAFRSGKTQIVLARPGGVPGAIVAPILGVDGCVGALSAEIRGGGEGSDAIQAVTAIVASHLAGVLATAAPESVAAPEPKAQALG